MFIPVARKYVNSLFGWADAPTNNFGENKTKGNEKSKLISHIQVQ